MSSRPEENFYHEEEIGVIAKEFVGYRKGYPLQLKGYVAVTFIQCWPV